MLSERLTKVIQFKVTEAEEAYLKQVARGAGRTISATARQLALGAHVSPVLHDRSPGAEERIQ